MIKTSLLVMFTLAIAFISGCKGVYISASSGEAIKRITKFWRSDTLKNDTSFTVLSEDAWYKDGIGISQIRGMFTEYSDSGSKVTTPVIGYRYFNLRKNLIYEYNSFSDTATVVKKFNYTDTAKYGGGFNFANRKPTALQTFDLLKDTVIDGVNFKRCNMRYSSFNGITFEGFALARCDKAGTNFALDTSLSNKMQCPVTYIRRFVSSTHGGLDIEVKYISNELPDSAVRVFAAWKKNESKFPVR